MFLMNPLFYMYLLTASASYFPVVLQMLLIGGVISGLLLITHLLGPSNNWGNKRSTFECGIEQQGDARRPMAIKYFLVAIFFVLFDVEVIFFYPYAINFRDLGWSGFGAVVLFIGFFLVSFYYIIKKGVLSWED